MRIVIDTSDAGQAQVSSDPPDRPWQVQHILRQVADAMLVQQAQQEAQAGPKLLVAQAVPRFNGVGRG